MTVADLAAALPQVREMLVAYESALGPMLVARDAVQQVIDRTAVEVLAAGYGTPEQVAAAEAQARAVLLDLRAVLVAAMAARTPLTEAAEAGIDMIDTLVPEV